jgi:pyruvate formate lyase activating enzyme
MRTKPKRGIIFNIQRFAIHDGPGIRTTIFFKGCPLNCWWCHNPEGQKLTPEPAASEPGCSIRKSFDHTFLDDKNFIGKEMSVAELISYIEKDRIFYEESGGGVTFSGGEPLMQPDFLIELLKECKSKDIHTVVDTSGFAEEKKIAKVAPQVDLFLYDLKIINDEDHLKYTGVSNQLILKNLVKLDELGKKIVIRIPIVPDITDTNVNLFAIRGFISYLKNILEVDLLPYHKTGDGKYKRFGMENKLDKVLSPEKERMENIKQFFSVLPCKVKIGG